MKHYFLIFVLLAAAVANPQRARAQWRDRAAIAPHALARELVEFDPTSGLLFPAYGSHVTNDNAPRWFMLTPDTLPISNQDKAGAPWIDGFLVRIDWGFSNGVQVATDTTVCTVAPCTQTDSYTLLDGYITGNGSGANGGFAPLTCAASLRPGTGGHPCYIGFTYRGITNPSTYNQDTPPWVFSGAWQQTVGAPTPQDAAFCSGYPQNSSVSPLPPSAGLANINSNICGVSGTSSCNNTQTIQGGIPVLWEPGYLSARMGSSLHLLQYVASASYRSQIKYISFALGTGDENTLTCATISGAAGTGMEQAASPQSDAGLKSNFVGPNGALAQYWTFLQASRVALGLTNIVFVGRHSMGVGLTSGGSTDPSFALLEAGFPLAYGNNGIASNGWKDYCGASCSGPGSDPINIIGASSTCVAAANGPNCTSNNWSNVMAGIFAGTIGAVKPALIIAQECNQTKPAGGPSTSPNACFDSSQSGTGAEADTLRNWLSLAGGAGVNVIELGVLDVDCIGNISPSGDCGSNAAIQLAYQQAALAWANKGIPIRF